MWDRIFRQKRAENMLPIEFLVYLNCIVQRQKQKRR